MHRAFGPTWGFFFRREITERRITQLHSLDPNRTLQKSNYRKVYMLCAVDEK